ncbi:MAG: hypothetical protein ACLUN5_02545 [Oscillospiraceae bacterium]
MNTVRASVRQVVEFSLHESDLSPAAFAARRMREGAAAHKARQSAGAKSETAYLAEQSLSAEYEQGAIALRVSGRADGLLLAPDGVRVVEEIKLGKEDNLLIPAHPGAGGDAWPYALPKGGLGRRPSAHFICG